MYIRSGKKIAGLNAGSKKKVKTRTKANNSFAA